MGNCVRKESLTEWGGDDWGSSLSYNDNDDDESPLREGKDRFGKFGKEVKVKISRKQLAQLVEKADLRGLSVNQLLAELMNSSDEYEIHQHRSWRPALHSIPEVN